MEAAQEPPRHGKTGRKSSETANATYAFDVRTGDAASEISVIDSNYERVAKSVGQHARFDLPGGMYVVKVKSGDKLQKQLINLNAKGPQDISFEPVAFSSPAPLEGTSKTHEYHVANAAAHSQKVDQTLGAGSELYVFVRDWTSDENRPKTRVEQPAKGLTLSGLNTSWVIDLNDDSFPGDPTGDAWKACNLTLDPGNYILTLQKADGTCTQQTLTTCPGWQTQVFLLLKEYGNEPDNRRADLANAAIYMARMGTGGFNPYRQTLQNETARTTELARRGLVNKRRVLTEDTLREVLMGKSENPMLGILGGYLLLLDDVVNEDLLCDVVHNLRGMLGLEHPDVEALAIRAFGHTAYRYTAPPMLFPAWSIVLQASVTQPDIIPEDSLANGIADRLWGGMPWLLWTPSVTLSAQYEESRHEHIQSQIQMSMPPAPEPPMAAMDSADPDGGAGWAMEKAPLSINVEYSSTESMDEEQLKILVKTTGLPRNRIDQILKTKK